MTGKADLKAAFRDLLGQRRERMEPPTPEELIAYREGLLSARERVSLEEKLAVFPEAAEALRDLARFPDLEPPAQAEPLTESHLRESWGRFRTRLETAERTGGSPALTVKAKPQEDAVTRGASPRWRIFGRLPAPAWSAVAVAALAVGWAAGWLTAPAGLSSRPTPEADVPVIELSPSSHTERDTGPPGATAKAGEPAFLVLELPATAETGSYRIEIEGPAGRQWTGSAQPTEYGDLHLDLPRGFLIPGEFRITASGPSGGEPFFYRIEAR